VRCRCGRRNKDAAGAAGWPPFVLEEAIMSTREFFLQRWEQEQPAFAKVLRAIPEGQLGYRPHERCTPAGALAWQLVEEQKQWQQMRARLKDADQQRCPGVNGALVANHDGYIKSLVSRRRCRIERG